MANSTRVVSSISSVTKKSSAVMPLEPPVSRRAMILYAMGSARVYPATYHERGMRCRRSKTSSDKTFAARSRARGEIRLYRVGCVEAPYPDVGEVRRQEGPQLLRVEQVDVERVLEIRRRVGGQYQCTPAWLEHPGHLFDVAFWVLEMLDQM